MAKKTTSTFCQLFRKVWETVIFCLILFDHFVLNFQLQVGPGQYLRLWDKFVMMKTDFGTKRWKIYINQPTYQQSDGLSFGVLY